MKKSVMFAITAFCIISQSVVAFLNPWWLLSWLLLVLLFGFIVFTDLPWVEKLFELLEGKGYMVATGVAILSLLGCLLTL